MRVLLSIKPAHVANILNGKKKYEFRRRIFKRKDIESVLIYCTRPVGQLVAEFKIAEIIEDSPDVVWERTHGYSGISRDYFDCYFSGRDKAFALGIGELNVFKKPIHPASLIANFTPPQSYRYVPKISNQLTLL